jgi:hypothetical protein
MTQIPRVNVDDELEIRRVFFGEGADANGRGTPFVVLCNDESSKTPISSVFADAARDAGSSLAAFRLIDCNHVLPESGKSIADRFKLNMKERPTIFLSGSPLVQAGGAEEPIRQVPSKHLKTGATLLKWLRSVLEPHAAKVETTQDLRAKCLDKDICALLLKGTKKAPAYLKDTMRNLLKEFPNVAFASIDASVLYAKNLEEYLPELEGGQPRFVVFRRVSGTLEKGGKRLITSIAPLPTNGVSYGQMSNLVAGVVNGSQKMEKIPALPTIKTRTKKLEQEERAKRERKTKRAQEGDVSPSSRAGGGTTSSDENDGSRDGRRAERERRRTEHRKSNNVKERTPEEIAEMERQRRLRMEKEAERWNVAPEDLPPGGDMFDDKDTYDDTYEGEGETFVEHIDKDEADDEDVMDLD